MGDFYAGIKCACRKSMETGGGRGGLRAAKTQKTTAQTATAAKLAFMAGGFYIDNGYWIISS